MAAQSGGPAGPQHPPPQYSPDRKWWWDGARWIPAAGADSITDDEKVWSLLSHLSIFVLLIIGPLILMLTAGKRSSYVRHHAAEALNFQITMTLLGIIVSTLISVIGVLQFELVWLIVVMSFGLGMALLVVWFVFPIRAAVRSYRGHLYTYPLTLRFVKPGQRAKSEAVEQE